MGCESSYKAYTTRNVNELAAQGIVSEEQCFEMKVLGAVFPFKVSNYVVDELVDWKAGPDDPIFRLVFPHRDMLPDPHFSQMADLVRRDVPDSEVRELVGSIQAQLNPHPAHQMEHNVPMLDGKRVQGVQHKYPETVLLFPSQGQTCHAYCTFCFRWAQFAGDPDLRFATRDSDVLVEYLSRRRGVSDLLVTGGDPLVMSAKVMRRHLDRILDADLPHIRNIRLGTKSLSYWPQRFVSDGDSKEVLGIIRAIVASGRHCAIMAHFNHPRELDTPIVREAIGRIHDAGAEIRCQSPLVRHINDDAAVWADMWREEVRLGCVPYYMFMARDTGAYEYFRIPLARAVEIYQAAYSSVSGLCRTVRGPSMSADPGKVQVLGTAQLGDEKVFVLRFLQGRNPEWVGKPFFAAYDPEATWLSGLCPAGGAAEFFFNENQGRDWPKPWEEAAQD